jgi:uncharacterized membrane protein
MTTFGPMQLLVVGFGTTEATGEIAAELRRLREHDIVRLVDMIVVSRDETGDVHAIETSDLSADESEELGAITGALIGFGAAGEEGAEIGALAGAAAADAGETPLGDDVWYLADAIPPGTTAAIAILEHRWAIPLRDAIAHRGGVNLADAWLHPADLVAMGVATAEQVEPSPA